MTHIMRINEFANYSFNNFDKYFVYENNTGKYSADYLVTPIELNWKDVDFVNGFDTLVDTIEYIKSQIGDKRLRAAYAYTIMDELSKIVGKKVDKLFDYGYYAFDPYAKGLDDWSAYKHVIATIADEYFGMINNLKTYGGEKRIFYFDGKPFTGRACYINGYNGYTYSKDNGLLCALIDNSCWTNKKPNALVDNNGLNICYPYYTGDGTDLYFKNGEYIGNREHPVNYERDNDMNSKLESIVNHNKLWVDMGVSVLWKNRDEKGGVYGIPSIKRNLRNYPTKEDYKELLDACELISGTCNGQKGVYVYNKNKDTAIFFGVDEKRGRWSLFMTSTEYGYSDNYYSFYVEKNGDSNIGVYDDGNCEVARFVKRT